MARNTDRPVEFPHPPRSALYRRIPGEPNDEPRPRQMFQRYDRADEDAPTCKPAGRRHARRTFGHSILQGAYRVEGRYPEGRGTREVDAAKKRAAKKAN